MSDIKKIKEEYLEKLKTNLNIETVNKIKTELFGKNGQISNSFKNLGSLPTDERKKFASDLNAVKEELQNIIVHGESGGGMVKISITCKNEIKKIDIDGSLFSEERDMLEDLLIAAFNDAIRKADKKTQESMSGMTSGLNLPPGMKLPF